MVALVSDARCLPLDVEVAGIVADLRKAEARAYVKLSGDVKLVDRRTGRNMGWTEYVNRLKQG